MFILAILVSVTLFDVLLGFRVKYFVFVWLLRREAINVVAGQQLPWAGLTRLWANGGDNGGMVLLWFDYFLTWAWSSTFDKKRFWVTVMFSIAWARYAECVGKIRWMCETSKFEIIGVKIWCYFYEETVSRWFSSVPVPEIYTGLL